MKRQSACVYLYTVSSTHYFEGFAYCATKAEAIAEARKCTREGNDAIVTRARVRTDMKPRDLYTAMLNREGWASDTEDVASFAPKEWD